MFMRPAAFVLGALLLLTPLPILAKDNPAAAARSLNSGGAAHDRKQGEHNGKGDHNGPGNPFDGLQQQINALRSQLAALQTQLDSVVGTPGPAGPKGDPGPAGPAGLQGADGSMDLAGASCPVGESLTGFDAAGNILCAAAGAAPVIGADCVAFQTNMIDGSLDLRNCDLRGINREAFNLDGADLRGAKLQGVLLVRFHLQAADLSGADLRGAVFEDTDFSWANLTGADLSHASMGCRPNIAPPCANFRSAILAGTDLRGTNLAGAQMTNVNLGEYHVPGSRPIWGDTTCPDGTSSFDEDGDDYTCLYNMAFN